MNNTIQLRNTTNEWAKHLRPFGKRLASKKERSRGKQAAKALGEVPPKPPLCIEAA